MSHSHFSFLYTVHCSMKGQGRLGYCLHIYWSKRGLRRKGGEKRKEREKKKEKGKGRSNGLYNEDTFIMRTFCNVTIGTNLYKSTSEMRAPLY